MTKRLAIIGGGSAGWMAAAYLHSVLNARGQQRNVSIELVESPDIPRISVGEATVPSIRHLLSVIGIDEIEFMRATDASFKQSIKYVNWVHNNNTFYHHPFTRMRVQPIDFAGINWLKSDRSIPFMDTCSTQPLICEWGLSPKVTKPGSTTPLSYAYHMNAQKFADYLRDISVARGVTHTRANIGEVKNAANGHIQSVELDNGHSVQADLYIDCTGFKALLMEKALNEPFESLAQYLLCDRAVTMHVPYDSHYPGMVRPYTTATAMSNGWIWDIPMANQRSVGYVHASQFISKEAAERELRAYQGPDTDNLSPRFVDFKVGHRKRHWVNNCIAIGLSGGFIEPLESTGLFLADTGAVLLAEHFPHSAQDMAVLADRYNRLMSNRYYEILDFINMHYCLTQRTDTAFWQAVQQPEHINPRLQAKLEYWKQKPPSPSDFEDQMLPGMEKAASFNSRVITDTASLWNHESYECILYGMHFAADHYRQKFGNTGKPVSMNQEILFRLKAARQGLPPHAIWLEQMTGKSAYPTAYKPHGWVA